MTDRPARLTSARMASPFAYLPHRAILSLTGPDTITLLERLVTHETANWAPGITRYGALLTPQGKVLADYLAIRTSDGVLMDVATSEIETLAKRLKLFRLRAAVEIEILSDVFVVAGLEDAPDGIRPISGADHVYLDPRYAGGRLRGLATKESWAAWYGYHPAEWSQTVDAYHTDRIAACVPEQGSDFGPAELFPADINMDLLGGVALKKGCFVGQEVVSRMHRRGKIRKRTFRVDLAAGGMASVGDEILAPTPIGVISSAEGRHALAQIRVDRWQTAQRSDAAVLLNDSVITIVEPDWLAAELTPMDRA
ncbi:MAG: hypothetical protein AAFY82_07130 [Pseudomonadota bacterium]